MFLVAVAAFTLFEIKMILITVCLYVLIAETLFPEIFLGCANEQEANKLFCFVADSTVSSSPLFSYTSIRDSQSCSSIMNSVYKSPLKSIVPSTYWRHFQKFTAYLAMYCCEQTSKMWQTCPVHIWKGHDVTSMTSQVHEFIKIINYYFPSVNK